MAIAQRNGVMCKTDDYASVGACLTHHALIPGLAYIGNKPVPFTNRLVYHFKTLPSPDRLILQTRHTALSDSHTSHFGNPTFGYQAGLRKRVDMRERWSEVPLRTISQIGVRRATARSRYERP